MYAQVVVRVFVQLASLDVLSDKKTAVKTVVTRTRASYEMRRRGS